MVFSIEDKIREVELGSAAGTWRRADSIITENDNWFQITTPSSKQFWLNGVHRSILAAEPAPQVVERVVKSYKTHSQKFRWVVGPSSRPENLQKLLLDNGVKHHGSALGMVAESENFKVEISPRVSIEIVNDTNINEYVSTSVKSWGITADQGVEVFEDIFRLVKDPTSKKQFFLARFDGAPAGSGAMVMLKKSGYFFGSSVLPPFRRRGIYSALLAKRVEVLRQRGIPLVTIQASVETSGPICKNLGFEAVSSTEIFVG